MLTLPFILIAFVDGPIQVQRQAEPLPIELQMLEHRRALNNGELHIVSLTTNPETETGEQRESECNIVFSGTQLRIDHRLRDPTKKESSLIHQSENVRTDKMLISNNSGLAEGGTPLAVQVRHRNGVESTEPAWQSGLHPNTPWFFEPRIFGLAISPTGMLHGKPLECFVGSHYRESSSQSEDRIDGCDLQRVEFVWQLAEDGSSTVSRMWIDPARGYNLVKAETEYRRQGSVYVDSIDCQITQFGTVWFPKEVVYQRLQDGKVITSEVANVVRATFNQGVDPKSFDLSGMNVAAGTWLNEIPQHLPTRIWDGTAIVVPKARPTVSEPPPVPAPGRKPLIVGSLLALATVLLWLFFRAQKAARRPR